MPAVCRQGEMIMSDQKNRSRSGRFLAHLSISAGFQFYNNHPPRAVASIDSHHGCGSMPLHHLMHTLPAFTMLFKVIFASACAHLSACLGLAQQVGPQPLSLSIGERPQFRGGAPADRRRYSLSPWKQVKSGRSRHAQRTTEPLPGPDATSCTTLITAFIIRRPLRVAGEVPRSPLAHETRGHARNTGYLITFFIPRALDHSRIRTILSLMVARYRQTRTWPGQMPGRPPWLPVFPQR